MTRDPYNALTAQEEQSVKLARSMSTTKLYDELRDAGIELGADAFELRRVAGLCIVAARRLEPASGSRVMPDDRCMVCDEPYDEDGYCPREGCDGTSRDHHGPTDDQIYNRYGMEGGIPYSTRGDTRDEHDPSL